MDAKIVSIRSLRKPINEAKRILKPIAKEAYIFGSFAESAAIKYESDIDLFIILT